MKRKILIIAMLPILVALFAIQSCKKDNTTFTKAQAFTQPVVSSPIVRADGTVLFTGSTVTLAWASENTGGDPVKWDVYFGTDASPALYKSGVTAPTLDVPVVDGQTYYWKVSIVDSRKVSTTSQIFSFTAVNGTNPAMTVAMSCTTDVATSIGLNLVPDKVVDLRLLVLKKSDMSIVATIDNGASSESYDGLGALPDGDYVLGVDIFSTINAGDFNAPINLSLSLNFFQLGMIDQTLNFPKVMTNAHPCSLYRTNLATVTKAGAVYSIASAVSYTQPPVIVWLGNDATYSSQVTTTESCDGNTMTGLGFGWMLDWWGETIVSGGTLSYTISGNAITIPLQKYCTTTYKGVAQPGYSVQGTGTIDNSGAYPVYDIHYDFIQSGQSIGTISNQYGWPTKDFEVKITTNPAGLKSAIMPSLKHPALPIR